MNKDFIITIDCFEGPLDLMIHLVKENKLDLFDLDILVLANQYIAYIKAMEELNLEIASEYLVELAALIEYKSRKLLPQESAELSDEYRQADPDELVRRLIEYQKYKEVSQTLDKLAKQRQKLLERPASSLIDQWVKESDAKIEPMAIQHLFRAMERCQKRLLILQPIRISSVEKEKTIDERIRELAPLIAAAAEEFSFDDLCADAVNRIDIIITFLAVLEMLKNQLLVYRLKKDTIYLRRGENYAKQ